MAPSTIKPPRPKLSSTRGIGKLLESLVTNTNNFESNVIQVERNLHARRKNVAKELQTMDRDLITLTRKVKKFQGSFDKTVKDIWNAIDTLQSSNESETIAVHPPNQHAQISPPIGSATPVVKKAKQQAHLSSPKRPKNATSRTQKPRTKNQLSSPRLPSKRNRAASTQVPDGGHGISSREAHSADDSRAQGVDDGGPRKKPRKRPRKKRPIWSKRKRLPGVKKTYKGTFDSQVNKVKGKSRIRKKPDRFY